MSIHLQRELEKLKKHLLSLCAVVEDQVQMAIRAFLQRDENLALEVERRDNIAEDVIHMANGTIVRHREHD